MTTAIRRRSARWYKLVSLWDQETKSVMDVSGEGIVVQGYIPPLAEVPVCLTPTSISGTQGAALQKILEANFRGPVVLLTSNIQLCKLKPISDREAQDIMRSGGKQLVKRAALETVQPGGRHADAMARTAAEDGGR